MLFDFMSVLWRLAAVSIGIAVVLRVLGTDANAVLAQIGATPAEIWTWIAKGWELALPNLILGVIVLLPLWLIIYMLKPPRN